MFNPQPTAKATIHLGKPSLNLRYRWSRAAFSLLELMIVLTIMVAIVAVAWPNLRRPIADSNVEQAASGLREQIATCRQAAAVTGQPSLIRFEAGQSAMVWGSWQSLIAEQLAADDSLSENESAELKSWQLPPDIVFDEVQLDAQTYQAVDSSTDNSLTASTETQDAERLQSELDPLQVPSSEPASLLGENKLDSIQTDNSKTRWYLPFMPNGRSRDAVIVLRDIDTGSRVALEIDSITGMMRTTKLQMPASPQ